MFKGLFFLVMVVLDGMVYAGIPTYAESIDAHIHKYVASRYRFKRIINEIDPRDGIRDKETNDRLLREIRDISTQIEQDMVSYFYFYDQQSKRLAGFYNLFNSFYQHVQYLGQRSDDSYYSENQSPNLYDSELDEEY